MTQAEKDFLTEYTRKELVSWASAQLEGRDFAQTAPSNLLTIAQEKGWVGSKAPYKVLAKGFSAATAFLKR